ncbi:MAG: hypothetical protein QHH15_05165 [Candidatus Thermoplasmatota archaeon]|jgi:hypothetical protein|nr:hypothetical protein [Candidatus Thermoplasmatota archaeon]
MKKINRRIFLFISISIFICSCFQPIIFAINVENNQQYTNQVDYNLAFIVACAK